jgi:hypothetical protein
MTLFGDCGTVQEIVVVNPGKVFPSSEVDEEDVT